ncbi:MFS transporter [Chromobacterium haemolyticum]|uniref:MFS transporter n=1 Tax=Chromobacterium haemolyticum TaxID=394935 RepID=UPI003082ADDB
MSRVFMRETEKKATSQLMRKFWPLYAILFLVGAEMYVVAPLLENISSDLRVSLSAAAQLVTAYVLVQAIGGPFIGLLYKKLGPRSMIVTGIFIFAIGNMASALAQNYGLVLACRGLAGLGVSFFGPAAWIWMSQTVAPHLRGRSIGYGMAAFALGQVFGVPIGAFSSTFYSWRAVVAVLGGMSLLALPSIWKKIGPLARLEAGGGPSSNHWLHSLLAPWRIKELQWSYLLTFLFHAASLGAYTFLAVRLMRDFALSETLVGIVGVLSGVGTLLGSIVAGYLSDKSAKRGRSSALLLTYWVLGVSVAIPIALGSPWVMLSILSVLAWFVFSGAFDSNQQDSVMQLSGESPAPTLAWNTSMLYAAGAVGIWTLGIAPESSVFIATSACLLALLGLLAALRLRMLVR